MQRGVVVIVRACVCPPSGLIVGAMRAAATRHCAIQTRIVKQRTFANDGDARRQTLHQRAFGFLGVARALDAQIDVGTPRQAAVAIPHRTAVDRDCVCSRAFGAGLHRQIAAIGRGHTAAGSPRLLFLEPDFINAGDLVSRHSDDVVDEILIRPTGFVIAQILEIQQRQTLLGGVMEDQTEGGLLILVEPEDLRQQDRAEGGDAGPHRHADATGPEREELRRIRRSHPGVAGVLGAFVDPVAGLPRPSQPGQVALEVRHHHRHAGGGQLLGDHLEGLGLAGAGGAGDQTVAVHHRQRDSDLRGRIHLAADDHRTEFQGLPGHRVAGCDLLGGSGGRGGGRFRHGTGDYLVVGADTGGILWSAVRDQLVWIDCEMTGLDLASDRLIEIAALVTDAELNVLGEGIDVVIHTDDEALDGMVEVVARMHSRSGLIEEVRASTIDVATAQDMVMDYIRSHVTAPKTAPLAGNSIATDRGFLARDMPELDEYLHYRMIDVSSIKELCRRWYPRIYYGQPEKGLEHRALADIQESIRELRYYRRTAFVPLPGPSTSEIAEAVAELEGRAENDSAAEAESG